MDNNNLFGEVLEGLKGTAGTTVKQAAKAPLDILETGIGQVSGKSGQTNKQKAQDQQDLQKLIMQDQKYSDEEASAIRRNLAELMTAKAKPNNELPKYISGKPGAARTLDEIDELNKKAEEMKKKQEKDIPMSAKLHQGSSEAGKFAAG